MSDCRFCKHFCQKIVEYRKKNNKKNYETRQLPLIEKQLLSFKCLKKNKEWFNICMNTKVPCKDFEPITTTKNINIDKKVILV